MRGIANQSDAMDLCIRCSGYLPSDFDHSILRGDTAVYGSGSSQPLFWISN
jgi:hypothetical protein